MIIVITIAVKRQSMRTAEEGSTQKEPSRSLQSREQSTLSGALQTEWEWGVDCALFLFLSSARTK